MRILVICQYYYPEPLKIADLCEELVKKGNDVTVITGIPNYPMGEIYEEYKQNKRKYEEINGVKVYRCFTIPRKSGTIMRMLNYYSYAISSKIKSKKLKDEFDVVLVYQLSPVLMAKAGIEYKKKFNKKMILYCLDVWPESLTAGGIKKGSFIYKHYYKVSKKIYKSCDKILVTSKSFINYFKDSFNIEEDKITYLPQYAESIFDYEKCKKHQNEKIDLLFAGNMGKAQSIETIVQAADILKNKKNIFFHLVGDGSEFEHIKEKINTLKLDNIILYGRKPVTEMPDYYKKADAMLVTLQADSFISQTLPGKVQTYMAAGKPIIGAIDGEGRKTIEDAKCGYCGKAEDYKELAENIIKFAENKNKEQLGENAYNYYNDNFTKEICINKMINEFKV